MYFMGICGAAMGNVALLMRSEGHEVFGCDEGVYPPMSDVLKSNGIEVYEGFDAARLKALTPDLVVVGNVVSRGHPEMEWLLDTRSFPYVSMPELLQEYLLNKRNAIVVTGTHGKTTTASLTAYLLRACGLEPGYLIGGVPRDLPSGATIGNTADPFVIEGDEYDSAFFDKRSKFIHYPPSVLIINNIEFDHGDIFRDLEDVKRSFRHLLRIAPKSAYVLVNGDDDNIASLLPIDWACVLRVGVGEGNDLRIKDFHEDQSGAVFELVWQGKSWGRVKSNLGGLYNVRNMAMAALASALSLNAQDPTSFPLDALSSFQGVKRRQELLHEDARMIVIEDFGHHPTAIEDTLVSLKKRYPNHRLFACYEPRSNTACSKVFEERMPGVFACADRTWVGKIHRGEGIPQSSRIDLDAVCARVNATKGPQCAEAFSSNEALLDSLLNHVKLCASQPSSKQLVCFFSNGSFDGVMQAFVDTLKHSNGAS